MEVRRLLKEQLLTRFLELSGNIYPDLVRVFYTNLQLNGDILVSHVKGVELEITNEVWTAVTGLKFSGLKINKGNTGIVDEFNKMKFYKNCLKDPQARVTKFGVRGLKLNERLIAFIVSWILTPRGNNHSTLSEEDLVLIYCIMNKIKLNWIHIIKDHMQKAIRLCDFRYPYAILITKFLQYFEVDRRRAGWSGEVLKWGKQWLFKKVKMKMLQKMLDQVLILERKGLLQWHLWEACNQQNG